MKFKMTTNKKPITAKDYEGKPCILSSSDRTKRWVQNNPNHWYSQRFKKWLKEIESTKLTKE